MEVEALLSPFGQAALLYADVYKWAVLPIAARSKDPLKGSHGYKDGTTDTAIVCSEFMKHPNSNVAIRTGKESNLVVVDVDPRNQGDKSLQKLLDHYGKFPDTVIVKSGGGGLHYYFSIPNDAHGNPMEIPCAIVDEGIELKSDGGYVVAPPSIHPDTNEPYLFDVEWSPDYTDLAPLPSWVLEVARGDGAHQGEGKDALESYLGKAFEAMGWLGKRTRDGRRAILCPFRDGHSMGENFDTSTILFPAREGSTLGWIHCFHASCKERFNPHKVTIKEQIKMILGTLSKEARDIADKAYPKPERKVPSRKTAIGEITLVHAQTGSHHVEPNPAEPKPPARPVFHERVSKYTKQGPRLPTGIAPIDQGWRGGARMGVLWAIGGAPGAGKTTLVTQLAHDWAKQGVPVAILAGDEPEEGIAIRLGQQLGLDRDRLEDWYPEEQETLVNHLKSIPLMVFDPDSDPDANVVSVAKNTRALYPEGPAVLIVDSLQTLAAHIPDTVADTTRAKVDYLLKQCKLVAGTLNFFVIVLSELARAAYKFKGESQVEDIAAGKESGGIEYAVGALSILRAVPDSDGLVVCTMPKSRLGKVDKFALRQDSVAARFALDTLPHEPGHGYQGPPESAESLCEAVFRYIKADPGVPGAKRISEQIRRRRGDVYVAVETLKSRGRVVNKGSEHRPRLHVAMTDPTVSIQQESDDETDS